VNVAKAENAEEAKEKDNVVKTPESS